MAEEWLLRRGGEEFGPMTPALLKQLAATGQLRPTDHVRKTSMDRFVPASAVKGLFPSDTGDRAPVVAEEARPAPHGEMEPEVEVPQAPVAAKGRPDPWARIKFGSLVASGCVVALLALILLASALRHRGHQDPPDTGVAASQPGAAAPQGAGNGALNSSAAVRAAPAGQDHLSDELRALPPDKAIDRAIEYLGAGDSEANRRTAFLLVRNAANMGDAKGMLSLSYCYSSGVGTPVSRADWLKWLRKSAEAREPTGMYEYSVAIRGGEYDGLGESDGMAWLRRSAAAGHQAAVNELKGIQVQGVVSALGKLFSTTGSNNDNSDATGYACQYPGFFQCTCRGFEASYGRLPGGREVDYTACKLCEHDQSDHRR